MLVSKLRGARDRKRKATGKCEGRRTHQELRPEAVALAKQLHQQKKSLRQISTELATAGHVSSKNKPFVTQAIKAMLEA